jgi:choice-of-anchor B domain-containing protein
MSTTQAQTTPGGSLEVLQGFARAVDVSDGRVFVGEPSNFHQPGAVYIFGKKGNNWDQMGRVMAKDGVIGDNFGASLSADGSRVLVGAPSANGRIGAAYIFERARNGKWSQAANLKLGEDIEAGGLGVSVALMGNKAFVGAPRYAEGKGSVFVYERSRSGDWSLQSSIMNPDTSTTSFGSALATDGDRLVVSAPNREGGTVFVMNNMNGEWAMATTLSNNQAQDQSRFGSALAIQGDRILVSAPRNNNAMGTVFVYEDMDGEWTSSGMLTAFDVERRFQFGASIAFAEDAVWVGAPGANGSSGSIYQFMLDENGAWSGSVKLPVGEQGAGDAFSSTMALDGNVAVVGLTGSDYGTGSAVIMEKKGSGEWMTIKMIMGEESSVLEPVTGRRVQCEGLKAEQFGCKNVDLISFLPINEIGGTRGVRVNDIWGWTDPETGTEYALIGRNEGTSFVDLSDPGNPVYVGNLPMTEGARANVWRDIKVYKNHAYIVADGAGEHGMQILDLTILREFDGEPLQLEATAMYRDINSAHNVVINEDTGFAYIVGASGGGVTCGGGLHMLNIQDPANPEFAGCFADPSTGRSGTGYSHDAQCVVYNGPDEEHKGSEICFGANETAVSIADVTDKENPIALSTATYPDYGYVHQGWLTEDHRYFFQNDELDELMGNVDRTRTMVWDVTDLDDPQLLREFFVEVPSSDHNLYIKDNKMYQSNYVSGLQVIDVSDPANPVKVGEFDTDPFSKDAPGFSGTWSNYPFFKSGLVIMSSGREGLFVLDTNPKAISQ